jgi:hypothetical protein
VCSLIDGDDADKPVGFCDFCKAWMCDICREDYWRRAKAAVKKGIRNAFGT